MSSFSIGGCGNTELRSPDDAPISQCHCGSNSSLWLEVNHIHFPIIRGNVPTAENIRKHSEGEKNNKHFWCLSYGSKWCKCKWYILEFVKFNLKEISWQNEYTIPIWKMDQENISIYGKIWRYKSFFSTVLFKF